MTRDEAMIALLAKHALFDLTCNHDGEGSNQAVCECMMLRAPLRSGRGARALAVRDWAEHLATVIQQAFAERDGEIVAWLRDRSEAVFDEGYHDKALALDDAADAIEAGEHRHKPSQPKEIAVVEAVNDSYQDELAHALATMVCGMGPEVAGYITRPLSDGRRWSVMPLDAEQAMRDARDARIRQAGVQQGLDMAAEVADGFDAPHVIDAGRKIAAAIRKLGGSDGTD